MSKIRLTKGELKRQRDSLKQFRKYLPTLLLKKQQLQMKILEVRREIEKKGVQLEERKMVIHQWVGLLGDPAVNIEQWIKPVKILTDSINIAGADVPTFKEILFDESDYDLYRTPFWIDRGIIELRDLVHLLVEVKVITKQLEILEKELRVTTQRVNLFEKIKIPECMENIRKISIYLGDQQANAVGISKVAKKKIEESELVEVAA